MLVVGGSIGGLTAAALLAESGCPVTVWERSPVPLEGRGAGIVLHPVTARHALERAGATLSDISRRADWFRFLDREGRVIHQEPCRYRFTAWNTLYRNLLERFPSSSYRFGHEMAGFDILGDRAVVTATNGDTTTCDLLVCADGITSTARRRLLPAVPTVLSGYLGWRGVVRESELAADVFGRLYNSITYYTPERSHILAYPIPGSSGAERVLNYVWYRNIDAAGLDRVMTDRSGRRRDLSVPPGQVGEQAIHRLRAEANELLPSDLASLVVSTPSPFIQAVVDVEVPHTAFGVACLIGDAAFVARPHAAAGTAKAAADAWGLFGHLRTARWNVAEALRTWEPESIARGSRLVARARRLGEMAQWEGTFRASDPAIIFGLDRAGDSLFEQ